MYVFLREYEQRRGRGIEWKERGKGRKEKRGEKWSFRKMSLSALKEKNGYLTKVEIDKMSCFMRHVATKITSYNAMPRRVVFLIKFFLDKCSYILKVNINEY